MKIKKNKGMGKRRRSNSMKREENTLQRERNYSVQSKTELSFKEVRAREM